MACRRTSLTTRSGGSRGPGAAPAARASGGLDVDVVVEVREDGDLGSLPGERAELGLERGAAEPAGDHAARTVVAVATARVAVGPVRATLCLGTGQRKRGPFHSHLESA